MTSEHENLDVASLLETPFSRRTALGALAAGAGAAALGLELGLPGRVVEAAGTREFHGAWPYDVPPTGHLNTLSTDGHALSLGIYGDLMEMPLAMYYWAEKKWLWLMATSGHFSGNTYVVTLRKGARWSDGSNFNAQDVLDYWTLKQVLGNVLFDYVDKITAPDNYTVVFHMKTPSTVVERYALHQVWQGGPKAHSVYGGWAKQFRDLLDKGKTVDSPEIKALRAQFLQFRPTTMVVNGPFQMDLNSITQGQVTLNRNPTSWANKLVGFDKIVLYNGETPTVTPVVLAGLVDYATHGFPPATDRAFQQKGYTVLRPPTYYGLGIMPNYAKVPALRNKVVRQALMHAVDRRQSGAVGEGQSGIANQYVSGFSDKLIPTWLDSATKAKLDTYEFDLKKAASLLESVGWKKGSDGMWRTDTGAKADWELLVEAEFADSSSTATNFATQMRAFGINISVRTITFTAADTQRGAGNFQLTVAQWGTADDHPHFAFVQDFLRYLPPITNGPGTSFSLTQQAKDFGTVSIRPLIDATGLGLDVAKQKVAVRKLALIFNDVLPIMPLWERYGNNPTRPGVRVAGWPKPGDPVYLNSPYTDSFVIEMLLTGKLHSV